MNRRTLLRTTIAIPALAALAACSSTQMTQVTSDVQAITTGLTNIMPQIATVVPAAAVAQLTTYLNDLKSLAATVSGNVSATTIQQVAKDVEAFADLVLPLVPGGAVFVVAINAALALLPGLLAAVGVSAGTLAAPAMTPAQARAVLASFAH